MSQVTKTAMDLMSLPRELRDQIYDNLLTATYRAPAPYNIELPSSRLGILQTSSAVSQEALQVLYKQSTFLFIIDGPDSASEIHTMGLKAIELMEHFEIHISLARSAGYLIRKSNARLASRSASRLISTIANSDYKKKSCVIRMLHFGCKYVLDTLATAVIRLTGLETVIFKLQHDSICDKNLLSHEYIMAEGRRHALTFYKNLDGILARVLGPSEKELDSGGWYVLTCHPQSHVNKTLS